VNLCFNHNRVIFELNYAFTFTVKLSTVKTVTAVVVVGYYCLRISLIVAATLERHGRQQLLHCWLPHLLGQEQGGHISQVAACLQRLNKKSVESPADFGYQQS